MRTANLEPAVSNIVSLNGGPPPSATGEPNPILISMLEDTLAMARTGQLQSFLGTGFIATGERVAVWGPCSENVYEMLGALAWLQHEYVARQTGEAL